MVLQLELSQESADHSWETGKHGRPEANEVDWQLHRSDLTLTDWVA